MLFKSTCPFARTVNLTVRFFVVSIVADAASESAITGFAGSSKVLELPSFIRRAIFPFGAPALFTVELAVTPLPKFAL